MLIDIHGSPATFATRREQEWKRVLSDGIPKPSGDSNERGVNVTFQLTDLAPRGHPLDVDNLCEPLFAVLVGTRRWFGGRRPNIQWWETRKLLGDLPGCGLEVLPQHWPDVPGDIPLIDETYEGAMPTSAKDRVLVDWAEQVGRRSDSLSEIKLARLFLSFGSERTNIGDIAIGTVKSLVVCLYPL